MSETRPDEIIRAVYGRVSKKIPAAWVTEDIVKGAYVRFERGRFGGGFSKTVEVEACRHEDWKALCVDCARTIRFGAPDHLVLPEEAEARAAEMSQRILENGSVAAATDTLPLWKPGERALYDGDSGDGIHTFAELIEIEDEIKHAFD